MGGGNDSAGCSEKWLGELLTTSWLDMEKLRSCFGDTMVLFTFGWSTQSMVQETMTPLDHQQNPWCYKQRNHPSLGYYNPAKQIILWISWICMNMWKNYHKTMILKNQTQIAHPKVYQRNLHCDGLKSRWNPQANITIGAGNNTSLQQSQMVYFSRRFVKNHQFGWSNLISCG